MGCKFGAKKKREKFTVRYHCGKINVLPSNYQLLLMNYSQIVVICLIYSVSENVPTPGTLISNGVKHKIMV